MVRIDKNDFESIGVIANHCDLDKLNIAINEAENFDLEGLFCDFWYDILENWDNEEYKDLIDGSIYEGCNGNKAHRGVRVILAYYAYSRYIIINGFNDTPNGMVQKTNQFSMPTPLKELQSRADDYRDMGLSEYKKTLGYLCKNKDKFSTFIDLDCDSCGCNKCTGKTNNKRFKINSSIIEK